jgi:hypothetical protein
MTSEDAFFWKILKTQVIIKNDTQLVPANGNLILACARPLRRNSKITKIIELDRFPAGRVIPLQ